MGMKIVLATDGSEYSGTAARYIQRLGFGPDTEVVVLHVFKEFLVTEELEATRDFRKAGLGGAESLVEDFKKHLEPCECRVSTLVREGEPWREIIEGAVELGADLVVMGHKGLHGLGGLLLGSVTRKVVRHAEFSTLVVRELPPLERPMRVLYCTDGSHAAREAMDVLGCLPIGKGAEVEVLSVVDMEVSSLPEKYYPDEEFSVMMAELREHNRAKANKVVRLDALELGRRFDKVRERVEFGLPEQVILKTAEDMRADLVVMGSRGLHGIKGALVGSISGSVLRHADCGVLVAMVKP